APTRAETKVRPSCASASPTLYSQHVHTDYFCRRLRSHKKKNQRMPKSSRNKEWCKRTCSGSSRPERKSPSIFWAALITTARLGRLRCRRQRHPITGRSRLPLRSKSSFTQRTRHKLGATGRKCRLTLSRISHPEIIRDRPSLTSS